MPINTPYVGYQTPALQRVLYLQAGSGIALATDLINGTLTISAAGGGAVTGSGAAGQAAFWTGASAIGGDNGFFWDNTNKRLGLGVTAPALRLGVHAAAAGAPTLGTASGTAIFGNALNTLGLLVGTDSTGASWLQAQRIDATATAFNLWLQPSGGNVGIGTASAFAKLEVVGVSQVPSDNSTHFELSTGTGAYPGNEKLVFGIHDGDYAWIQAVKAGTAYRNISLNPTSGNVGIGTTAPNIGGFASGATVLTLVGTSTGRSGQIELGSNNSITAANTALGSLNFLDLSTRIARVIGFTSGASGNAGDLAFYTTAAGSEAERVRFFASGGVAIGSTTDPGAKLLGMNSDIQWQNNTGFGLLGNDGVRFLSYTTAGGPVLGSGAVGVQIGPKVTSYNGITTAGWGAAIVYAHGRVTGQTTAVTVASYTPASDGNFLIMGDGIITAGTGGVAGQLSVTWTDPDGSSTTTAFTSFSIAPTGQLGGISYIRAKGGVAITIQSTGIAGVGTTYSAEAEIVQVGQ